MSDEPSLDTPAESDESPRRPSASLSKYLVPAALFAMLLVSVATWQLWRSGGPAPSFEPAPPNAVEPLETFQLDDGERVAGVTGDRDRLLLVTVTPERRVVRQFAEGEAQWEVELGPLAPGSIAAAGETTAVATDDTIVAIIDPDGETVAQIDTGDAPVAALSVSPDGATIFVNPHLPAGGSAFSAETGEPLAADLARLPAPAPVFARLNDGVVELLDANLHSLVGFVDAPAIDTVLAYDGSFLLTATSDELIGYGPLGEVWRHTLPDDIESVIEIEPISTDEWLLFVQAADGTEVRSVARDDGAFTTVWSRPAERLVERRGGLVALAQGPEAPVEVIDTASGAVLGDYPELSAFANGLIGPDTVAVLSTGGDVEATVGRFSDGASRWQLSGPGPRSYWLVDGAIVEVDNSGAGGDTRVSVFGEN